MASRSEITTRPASGRSSPAITRSSVDLPLPLGPSRAVNAAVRHLDRDVVQGDEVAELLAYSLNRDAHQASFLLNAFIASSVPMAISASTSEAA